MTFHEVKSKIEKISADILSIKENDFDDIKDVELQESFIKELIYDYCVARKYEVEGFPFKQLKKIEAGEPGYDEDYLTWERMEYYVERLALEKEDVFELCFIHGQHYFNGMDREGVRNMIEASVAIAEDQKLSFVLTREEIEVATREIKPYRPKLP